MAFVRRRGRGFRPLAVLLIAFAAALLCVPAVPAHRPALIGKDGEQIHGKRHRWLHQSKMPLVKGRLQLITGACPGRPSFAGCIFLRQPRRLYMRAGAPNPQGIIYHELGHSFDLTLLRPRGRRAFKRTLKLSGGGWFSGGRQPAELFAEAYALCSRFGMKRPAANELGWTGSVYRYRPSRRQHRAACRIIAAAGAKRRRRAQPAPDTPPVIKQPSPPAIEQPGGPTVPELPAPSYPLP